MRLAPCLAGSPVSSRPLPCVLGLKPLTTPRRNPDLRTCHAAQPRRQQQLHQLHSNQQGGETGETTVSAKALEQEEEQFSPYLDSMLRSFALGIGVGVLFELGHVLFQCILAGPRLPDLIPDSTAMESLLCPLRMWDNLAAMTGTFFFYVVEVGAIMAVLRQYPNDNKSAYKALQSNVTLSKRLLPISLTSARRALYLFMTNRSLQPSAASAMGTMQDTLPSTLSQAAPGAPPTTLASAVGTAVLERPPAAAPTPAPAQTPRSRAPSTSQLPGFKPPTLPKRSRSPDAPKTTAPRGRPAGLGSRPTLKKLPGTKVPHPVPAGNTPPAKAQQRARGSLDPSTASFLSASSTRAKFINDRRAYLKNFWYAAALSSNLLPGKPLEVQILGRTVVLFRDAATGKPKCLDNVCPHRGAPLGKGWLQQIPTNNAAAAAAASCSSGAASSSSHPHATTTTCITCPYHGWAFDSTGVLKSVPSQDSQDALPRRSLLDAYPVEERGGFIWLFFGSSKIPAELRPPIPSCPELEDPSWTKVYGEIEFDAPHWGVFDNLIDMTHVHYVHDDSFGNKEKPMIRNMEVAMSDYSVTASFKIHNKPSSAMWEWTAIESVPIEATAHLPSSAVVKNFLGAGVSMVVFNNTVPVSAERSVIRFCHIRNFAGWEGLDTWARAAMLKILREDKAVVEKLRPDSVRHEVSLQADMPQIAFRRLRQSWVDAGYAADPEDTPRYTGSLDM